jgi:hypothetical protein
LEKISKNYSNKKPILQLRLIDDIFGIWSGTKNELLQWVQFLNDSHHSIKFTLETSETDIPFLDTLVYIDNNKIKTKLYKKPTDNKQYLHYDSDHPQHVKNAIPYAQALRYRRIIEDDKILEIELEKLKQNFLDRAYPENVVNSAFNRVLALDRMDVIKYKNKTLQEWNYTPLILSFNNAFVSRFNRQSNVHKLLSNSWEKLINSTPALSNLLTPKIVFRKSNTINQLLVSTMFPPPRWARGLETPSVRTLTSRDSLDLDRPKPKGKSQACNSIRCKTCELINESNNIESTCFNKKFFLNDTLDCLSSNIIYVITCSKCKIQYVGESSNPLRMRMSGHRSCVQLNKDTPVGIHFNSPNHNISHLSVTPIEKLKSDCVTDRRTREFYWQLELGTTFPNGLNGFPVKDRNRFKNLDIHSFTDLEVFWALINLEDST